MLPSVIRLGAFQSKSLDNILAVSCMPWFYQCGISRMLERLRRVVEDKEVGQSFSELGKEYMSKINNTAVQNAGLNNLAITKSLWDCRSRSSNANDSELVEVRSLMRKSTVQC